jgi:endonuclease-3 related protein
MKSNEKTKILTTYDILLSSFCPQGWWPLSGPPRNPRAEKKDISIPKHHNGPPLADRDRFEIMLGAILTQNTAWTNVEKAISSLHLHHLLSLDAVFRCSQEKLASRIRSSGYYNQKAKRIKSLCTALQRTPISTLKRTSLNDCRSFLLSIQGIGPETADSILLYALGKPTFVVDAYTMRIFSRLGIISGDERYDEIRLVFEDALPSNVGLFKEYHALIVKLGKDVCRKRPLCASCPLMRTCAFSQAH